MRFSASTREKCEQKHDDIITSDSNCVVYLPPEWYGEVRGSSGHPLHGPGQSHQAFISNRLHQICASASLHRAGQPLPLLGGNLFKRFRDKPTLSSVTLSSLSRLFILQQHIIDPVRKALDYYTEMEKALEREKQNRTICENAAKNKETAAGRQSSADGHTDAAGPDASKPDAQWAVIGRRLKDSKNWLSSKDRMIFLLIWAI